MKIVIVTGGLGSGKSTAVRYLSSLGAQTLDLDELAKRLLDPGSPVLDAVARRFGSDITRPDGSLDRSLLASRAFKSAEETRALNAIVHPAVIAEIRAIVAGLRSSSTRPSALVIEVPLLSEAPELADIADVVVALRAPEELRTERASDRNTLSEEEIRRRMALQATDEERSRLADVEIENAGTAEHLLRELDRVWRECVLPGEGR